GAEQVILTITSLLVVPMVLPTIWGLSFGKITQKAVWYATGLSFLAAFFTKVGIPQAADVAVLVWLSENSLVAEVGVGLIVPLAVLALFERFGQRTAAGFVKLGEHTLQKSESTQVVSTVAAYPARLLAYSIGALSVLMYALAFTAGDKKGLVIGFGVVLSGICGLILWSLKKIK